MCSRQKAESMDIIICYERTSWSKEMKIEDYVLVAIDSAEFGIWLDEYYKQHNK